jgi:glutamate-5-semialdehyde dehydrogenase
LSAAHSAPAQLDPALLLETRAVLQRARAASWVMAQAPGAQKNRWLARLADRLDIDREKILLANALDLQNAVQAGRSGAMVDRLRLDDRGIESLRTALREIALVADPVGRLTFGEVRPQGFEVRKQRVPLGVIGMVYESRPNVTIDAAALCLKAGNAVVLRGGSEALHSNSALIEILRASLDDVGLPADAVQQPATAERAAIHALVAEPGGLDLCIPRGGTQLIDFIMQVARVPVIQHYQGICHLYVHSAADLVQATRVVVNAKAQRPGVCNAMEAVLVDAAVAKEAVPLLAQALVAAGVQVRACERAIAYAGELAVPAQPDDYGQEFLDLICLMRVVDDLEGALAHIRRYGSRHTEGILTRDIGAAHQFAQGVDASCVVVNASTRLNDGGCLGLGAEIGISTTKLHAYGPMGLDSLTTERWLVVGDGHLRQ